MNALDALHQRVRALVRSRGDWNEAKLEVARRLLFSLLLGARKETVMQVALSAILGGRAMFLARWRQPDRFTAGVAALQEGKDLHDGRWQSLLAVRAGSYGDEHFFVEAVRLYAGVRSTQDRLGSLDLAAAVVEVTDLCIRQRCWDLWCVDDPEARLLFLHRMQVAEAVMLGGEGLELETCLTDLDAKLMERHDGVNAVSLAAAKREWIRALLRAEQLPLDSRDNGRDLAASIREWLANDCWSPRLPARFT